MCLKATCTSGGVLRPLLDIRKTITSLGCQGVASSVAIMEQAYTNTAVDYQLIRIFVLTLLHKTMRLLLVRGGRNDVDIYATSFTSP